MAVAAASDLASRRIPNALSLTVAVAGLAASTGPLQAASGLVASAICLALMLPLWRRRAIGGGDVKLLAAAAAWVRLEHLFVFGLAVALCGGLLALIVLARASAAELRLVRANAVASLAMSRPAVARSAGTSIPYGVAIALGAAIATSGALS
ncbi:peptidase A24A prepilin type IV [Anaeromyxobacter dehalogenans 2CP-1]|uniref:Peptidase A24A prepilin type IV n=1 Tax=Anaeromyxobacter dehalogenans (strain ATCC BAA-258 / DSM 21875 / 2CP-1) TaxID=455488 RepID=B8JFG2_ANAD2|nr:peptidase A24A prepilin type IV [Anaeromyxobacter dehalogenans 2CP-1]